MKVQLDMYQTLAIAVLVLLLGSYLRKKIKFLERFCIPAPVVGGLLFAIFTCICYVTHILEFSFDDTLKEVCMVFFFTSVGFQANLKGHQRAVGFGVDRQLCDSGGQNPAQILDDEHTGDRLLPELPEPVVLRQLLQAQHGHVALAVQGAELTRASIRRNTSGNTHPAVHVEERHIRQ